MASGALYTYPENFRAFKSLIAAEYSGAKLEVAKDFVFGQTNKSGAFLKKFPFGKVPCFEGKDGTCLFESNAIAYHVANSQLRGTTDLQKAQILQWISFADSEILPAACTWVFPCLGIMQFNKQSNDRAREDIARALKALDAHLLTRTFLVGDRITLADICVCCTVLQLYQHVLDPSFREPYCNVNRWFLTMVNQPQFKKVIGEIKLCDQKAVFDAKKYQEFQAKLGGTQKVDKKATKVPKKEKAEKPKPEAAAAGEPNADADEDMPVSKEPKDPFAAYPKGNFNMDDFKRCYSNEDEAKSIPYFFEKFDPENYSVWFGEYKYNSELAQVFMSCNLISGMFQRLDKLRKNAFASVCLFGEDNNSSISGVWVWKGHDLAFELSPDWQIDYESYTWKKLDYADPKTKKMIEQYFAWVGTDDKGRKFTEGKIFK